MRRSWEDWRSTFACGESALMRYFLTAKTPRREGRCERCPRWLSTFQLERLLLGSLRVYSTSSSAALNGRRPPGSLERGFLRPVEPHDEVDQAIRSRQPVGLFVLARRVLLDADGQRAVPVLLVAGGRGSVRKKHGNFAESRLR